MTKLTVAVAALNKKKRSWKLSFLSIVGLLATQSMILLMYHTSVLSRFWGGTSTSSTGEPVAMQVPLPRSATGGHSWLSRINGTITASQNHHTSGVVFPRTKIALTGTTTRNVSSMYHRVDEMAPTVLYATTHFLQSVPSEMRLPKASALNETILYRHDPWTQLRRYVFEFNPSIVQLPVVHRRPFDNAAYLASYRVSTHHNCFHQDRNDTLPQHSNYLGLAVLNERLEILQETTVLFSDVLRKAEDYRLFVLNDELYVGSFAHLFHFWIGRPGNDTASRSLPAKTNGRDVTILRSLSPSNLTITVRRSKLSSRDRNVLCCGKSLSYFTDGSGRIVMEPFPMERKEILSIPGTNASSLSSSTGPMYVVPNATLPDPSFHTADEASLALPAVRKPAITGDRGSYCCAKIVHQGRSLLLGISHSKTRTFHSPAPDNPAKNQYFSSFYALEAEPPFHAVARTGRFCFGGGAATEHPISYYGNLTAWRVLEIGGETLHCPGIHFVSGMTASIDGAHLIIAYGVNDCSARFVVVSQAEVLGLLFPP